MNREIEINGRKFKAAEITFGTIRKLSQLGVDFNHLGKNMFTLVNAYVQVSTRLSEEAVDEMIQQHILKGGSLEDILKVFQEELDDSDFFQALAKTEQKETEEAR